MIRRLVSWFRGEPEQLICPVTIGVVAINNGVLMKLFLNDTQEIAVALSNVTAMNLSALLESCVVDVCRSQGVIPGNPGPQSVH